MKINELKLQQKAGIIPYYVDQSGQLFMMFMIPSDPAYGGHQPQIAKGGIDSGENAQEAAIREGEEELGLKRSNIKTISAVGSMTVGGLQSSYSLSIFAALIADPNNFSHPHYETGSVHWLSTEQFSTVGRKNQVQIVQKTHSLIGQ